MLTSFVSVSFAETPDYEGAFGVITNAEGEVVEIIPMPRQTYLDKTFSLTPGDALTTYQYEPNKNFFAGFVFGDVHGETTSRNGTVLLEIYGSSTIGGDGKTLLKRKTFSTNFEDNWNNPYFSDAEGYAIVMGADLTTTMRYFNAKYTNKSSFTIDLHVIVGVN